MRPRYQCHGCGGADMVGQSLATTVVREIRDGLLVDREGFLLPYCLSCRPRRFVDRIDLDDLLVRDVRYGLHPGTSLRLYRTCRSRSCPVSRWPPRVGPRLGRTCPWCPASVTSDQRWPAGHEEDFALWFRELRAPSVRSS